MSVLSGFLLFSGEGGAAGTGQNYYIAQELIVKDQLVNASIAVQVPVVTAEDVLVTVDDIQVEGT